MAAGAAGGGGVGVEGAGGGGEVRIVAPLGAPRSSTGSPTMTAPLAPLMVPSDAPPSTVGGVDNNLNVASYETTTHFEERTTRYTTHHVDLLH